MVKKKDFQKKKSARSGNVALKTLKKSPYSMSASRRKRRNRQRMQQNSGSQKKVENASSKYPRYAFSTDIPDSYNETYICAIPRNPDWMFVYWELAPEVKESIEHHSDVGSKYILRIEESLLQQTSDIDESEKTVSDTEINTEARNWYVKMPQPGKEYTVSFGNKTMDGDFHPIITTEPFEAVSNESQQNRASGLMLFDTDTIIDFSTETEVIKAVKKSSSESSRQHYLGSASPD